MSPLPFFPWSKGASSEHKWERYERVCVIRCSRPPLCLVRAAMTPLLPCSCNSPRETSAVCAWLLFPRQNKSLQSLQSSSNVGKGCWDPSLLHFLRTCKMTDAKLRPTGALLFPLPSKVQNGSTKDRGENIFMLLPMSDQHLNKGDPSHRTCCDIN